MKMLFFLLFAVYAVCSNVSAAIYEDSLVMYLQFESEQNGVSFDSSNYENNSTSHGASLVSDGRIGNAYSLDYADSLSVADSTSLNIQTNSVTISTWFQPYVDIADMPSAYPILLIKRPWLQGGYAAHFIKSSGRIIMQYCSDGGSSHAESTTAFRQNTWYHYTGILDNNTLRVYINGNLQGTASANLPIGSSAGVDMTIGSNFKGKIDDVAVWNRALNSSEVQQVYSSGVDSLSYVGPSPVPEPISLLTLSMALILFICEKKLHSKNTGKYRK